MFLVYNSDILSENEFCLLANDRAFQYGDGLFETIRYENGRVWYWPDHFARLTAGMAALQLNQPDGFSTETVYQGIRHLLSVNDLTEQTARIKIQIWRQSGGLYTPSTNDAHILISARAGQGFSLTEKSITGIYEAFRLVQSPVSAFKTLNALPYVMAGLYRQQHAFDDVILLDTTGNLAECLASNLFWYTNQTLFTPSLQTGCIGGIVRQQLLRIAPSVGIIVSEGIFKPTVLTQAEVVFCANVMGIQSLRQISGLSLLSQVSGFSTNSLLNALFAQLQR
ncbi:aminotransferase IV [Spirosoma sp. HMF4905]|uniref:branched-chain-amino-acid transaminase n=1 Tax=Spirosoma arboris TaxID=2682092 RepID=A0A7K1S4R2_9BACT|nr:aminotransferase class IV [Spirosoma arboris]MVM28809.1 aminotransferase IV [Spirosoma arboris]